MTLKFQDKDIAVFHGIFRGVRVRVLATGAVTKPGIPLLRQTLNIWRLLGRYDHGSKAAKGMADSALFRDCGRLCIDPSDAAALTLMLLSPEAAAQHYWREGQIDALAAEMLK